MTPRRPVRSALALVALCFALGLTLASCAGQRAPARATVAEAGAGAAPAVEPHEAQKLSDAVFGPEPAMPVLPGPKPEPGPARASARLVRGDYAFLVYGDTRSNHDTHRRVIDALARHTDAAFVCHTGDIVGDGSLQSQWDNFLEITWPLCSRIPFYPAIGNHDLPRSMAYQALAKIPGAPKPTREDAYYYGVVYGDVTLVVLDSESLRHGDDRQLTWAHSYLAQATTPYKIVALHRPLWSPGPNGSAVGIRERLTPILRATGVQIVFAAHDHMYYRTYRDGVCHIITAGGGAPLYDLENRQIMQAGDVVSKEHHIVRVDVTSAAMTVTAIGLDGSIIDQLQVPAAGR